MNELYVNAKLERIRKEAKFQVTVPAFARRKWGKSRKATVKIAGLCAEIWTRDFPKTKQEY
jgi:hypothetical protein